MDPTEYGREAGRILGGLARLVVALRGSSSQVDVEAKHVPEKPRVPCSDCNRTVENGQPEHLFVTVHALTSGNYQRVRVAGICNRSAVVRKLRQWSRRTAWHEIEVTPFGGHLGPLHRPEILRRFGERRNLPATVEPGNPLTFRMSVPDSLPSDIERGRKFRVWVGKPFKGGLVSDVIELPQLTEQEPPPRRQCSLCQSRANHSANSRHSHRGATEGTSRVVDE